MVLGARLHAHRVLGAGVVDDFERTDAALRDALDFACPAGRHVAGLHPVVDHRAVELEGASNVGLAAENIDQSLSAVHGCQVYRVKLGLTMGARKWPSGVTFRAWTSTPSR